MRTLCHQRPFAPYGSRPFTPSLARLGCDSCAVRGQLTGWLCDGEHTNHCVIVS